MKRQINIRIDDDLYGDLRAFAKKGGVTVTDVIIAGARDRVYGRGEVVEMSGEAPPVIVRGADKMGKWANAHLMIARAGIKAKKAKDGGFFNPRHRLNE